MKTIRPYTTLTVRTTDGRYRHMLVTAVADQDHVTGRIGLMGSKKVVNATRQASTDTRGEEFVQA